MDQPQLPPASETPPIPLADEAATQRLGVCLGRVLRPRDVVALHGDLGTGKTTLARALITALTGEQEVPSPTFTLVQTYDAAAATIWHFDLYRLKDPEEVWELGLEEALESGIILIEWPQRLGPFLPKDRLDLSLTHSENGGRVAQLSSESTGWRQRLRDLS